MFSAHRKLQDHKCTVRSTHPQVHLLVQRWLMLVGFFHSEQIHQRLDRGALEEEKTVRTSSEHPGRITLTCTNTVK